MRVEISPIIKDWGHISSQLALSTEVVQGEWKISNEALNTWRADSCLVLAAHNLDTSIGLLGHFSCVSVQTEAISIPELRNERIDGLQFNEALKAITELGEPRNTSVWLGGCAIRGTNSTHVQLGISQDRKYAELSVNKLYEEEGLSHADIHINWNGSEFDLGAELDCQKGRLLIHLLSDD